MRSFGVGWLMKISNGEIAVILRQIVVNVVDHSLHPRSGIQKIIHFRVQGDKMNVPIIKRIEDLQVGWIPACLGLFRNINNVVVRTLVIFQWNI